MELIAVIIITAILAHVAETVRDEHGHVRDTSRKALKAANPGRSVNWVRRHAAARTARWWGHELIRGFPAIRGNYEADRDHVRLLRTRGEADRFRTRAAILEELRRAKAERDEAAAEHERQRGLDAPPEEEPPEPPPAEPEPGEGADEPPPGKRLLPGQFFQPGLAPPRLEAVPEPEDPRLNEVQRDLDRAGKRNICAACGNPGTPGDPLVVSADGYRVHASHTTDPADGYYAQRHPGPEPVPGNEGAAPGTPQQPEGDTMPDTDTAAATGITGEAGGYEQAVAQAGQVQALAAVLQSQMENYQSELVTNAKLGGDTAVMSSMDQVMEAVQQMAAGMAAHLQALTAHEPGHEYATSVAAPADTGWLKSA